MSGKGYVEVKVRVKGDTVICDPEWARCFWVTGPDCIRWTMADADVPKEITRVVIEWKNEGPPYKSGSPFYGSGYQASPDRNRLNDILTSGNRMEKGFYRYWVYCYDANGKIVASADPGGSNDPVPPGDPLP